MNQAELANEERRWRLFRIEEHLMIHAIVGMGGEKYRLPQFEVSGLPIDYRVERVFHDPMRAAFMVMVSHPSFDPVPGGDMVPEIRVSFKLATNDQRGRQFI